VGVLGIGKPNTTDSDLTPAQRRLMEAFANQGAQAIERAQLEEQNRQIALLQSAEKLQNALLNSISHDLRTPLVAITGALSALDENYVELDEPARNTLIENARGEADRLNRLVGNLLNMTRIESGAIKLHLEPGDVQDLIGTALDQLGRRAERNQIKVDVPANFPLIPMDFSLMVQVIVNLLENAVKYSPADSLIEVSAALRDSTARLSILDRGAGIPSDDLSRVFDKFYRVQRPESVSGTGLGLSISKGIVEAHGGRIRAANREGGGTILEVELPLEK
jgi:two-component system sensor histidine kinase KdpD